MSNKEKFWKMWRIVLQHLKESIENIHFDSVLHGNIVFEITTSERIQNS
jgi:hypothetical protein